MKSVTLVAVCLGLTASIAAAAADSAQRLDQLDTNGDRKLSRDEVAADPALAQRFEQMDVNKDGFLSRDELAVAKRSSICG